MTNFVKLSEYLAKDKDSVQGWFAHIDGEIIRTILTAQTGPLDVHGACAEIGVHHGKTFIALCLGLRSGEMAYCVDIFSDQHLNKDCSGHGDREILERNLERFGVPHDRYVVRQGSSMDMSSRDITDAVGPVRFFSVDGGHWIEIVRNDLTIAEDTLADGGVIALDDFHRPEWPEVSAGYFAWFASRRKQIVPFAIGFNKLYLCEGSWVSRYQALLTENAALKASYVKHSEFQGVSLPVFSEYILPEYGIKRRTMSYLRLFHPNFHARVRAWRDARRHPAA